MRVGSWRLLWFATCYACAPVDLSSEVDPINAVPTAVVNDAAARVGELVELSAAGSSDPDGAILSFEWSLRRAPESSSARLRDADQAITRFVPDRSGLYAPVGAAAGLVRSGGGGARAYSVAFETTLAPLADDAARTVSRGPHFKAANEALLNAMQSSPEFASGIRSLGIEVPTSSTGAALGKCPTNWSWHHVADRRGVMQLVPTFQHRGGAWRALFHPRGLGGFKLWGADY
jgi:hypothetical protein